MIILGIDPGSITAGYAFVETSPFKVLEYGVFHINAAKPLEDRLLHIITELEILLEKYKPVSLGMEGIFFAKNAKSALVLGHIRGAIIVACRKRGMSFSEYPPKVVKQAVTGNGAASKEDVANMIFARLGIAKGDLPLDASDALAIAWTHANPNPLVSALASNFKSKSKKTSSSLLKKSKKSTAEQWKEIAKNLGVKL